MSNPQNLRRVSDKEAGPRAQHQRAPWVPQGPVVTHRSRRSTLRELIFAVAIPILVVTLIRLFLFDIYMIPSGSMLDTLQIGDRIVTSKIAGRYLPIHRGDVVVFKDPGGWLGRESDGLIGSNYLVKRVIGLPGDVVACEGSGAPITINGHAIEESEYLSPGVQPSSFAFSVKVSAGNVFVLGDNRANSADSRYHTHDGNNGLVPLKDIDGVALSVYWPATHWRSLGRDDSIYARVGGAKDAR